ncbi:protein FANTASTIC FOUR 2-like [Henckelia pumila]|uniref:protein FANTASTIC FOUR 2-like n=1 Tax=Henckelia pumila TaxID=405737 RepID=UPI003C6E60BA
MSTIVYQNLVPCLETQFKETAATTINLKLAESMVDMNTSALEYGNWGLLPKDGKPSSFYDSSSFSRRLSAKSLELCTENLGSESGSDIVFTDRSSSINFSGSNLIQDSSPKHPRRNNITPKRSDDFPPPLSSMCGPNSLQMRRRREGGRLIIDAVVEAEPFRNSYLQAERSDGRLRLYFSTSDLASIEEEQQQEEYWCGEAAEEITDDETESELGDEEWELDGGEINNINEMGLNEKFQSRLSRCKEGGHGISKGRLILLCSHVWKPAAAFCVAT